MCSRTTCPGGGIHLTIKGFLEGEVDQSKGGVSETWGGFSKTTQDISGRDAFVGLMSFADAWLVDHVEACLVMVISAVLMLGACSTVCSQ